MFCFKLKAKESDLSIFLSHTLLGEVIFARRKMLLVCLKAVKTGHHAVFLLASRSCNNCLYSFTDFTRDFWISTLYLFFSEYTKVFLIYKLCCLGDFFFLLTAIKVSSLHGKTQLKDLPAISEENLIISKTLYSGSLEKRDLQNPHRVIEAGIVFSGSCAT